MYQEQLPKRQEQLEEPLEEKQEQWKNHMSLPLLVSGICFVLNLAFLPNLVQTHNLSRYP
jgi:hypothetical protein